MSLVLGLMLNNTNTSSIGFSTTELIQWLDKIDAENGEWVDSISGNNAALVESNCINSSGTTVLTFSDLTGVTITSSQGTATPTINGDTIEVSAGTLFDLLLDDGTYLPLAEGVGTDAYDVSGNDNHATIANEAFTTQDDFHYNMLSGFQVDDPAVAKIPRKTDGEYIFPLLTDIRTPGYWHNGAETKILQPSEASLITADSDVKFWYGVDITDTVVNATEYIIISQSTFDFTTVGAADNNTSTIFTATSGGSLGAGDLIRATGNNTPRAVGYDEIVNDVYLKKPIHKIFADIYTDYRKKNILLYSAAQSVNNLNGIYNFIKDALSRDETGEPLLTGEGEIILLWES